MSSCSTHFPAAVRGSRTQETAGAEGLRARCRGGRGAAGVAGRCACACSCDKLRRASPNRQMASFALFLTWYVGFAYSCMRPPIQQGEILLYKLNTHLTSDSILAVSAAGLVSVMVLVIGLALLVLSELPNSRHKLAFLSTCGVLCFVGVRRGAASRRRQVQVKSNSSGGLQIEAPKTYLQAELQIIWASNHLGPAIRLH